MTTIQDELKNLAIPPPEWLDNCVVPVLQIGYVAIASVASDDYVSRDTVMSAIEAQRIDSDTARGVLSTLVQCNAVDQRLNPPGFRITPPQPKQ